MDNKNDTPVTEEEYIAWFSTVKPREEMPERLYQYFQNTYRHRFPDTYHFIKVPVKKSKDTV